MILLRDGQPTVRIPVGGKVLHHKLLWGTPSLLLTGYRSTHPVSKAPGAWYLPLTSTSAELKMSKATHPLLPPYTMMLARAVLRLNGIIWRTPHYDIFSILRSPPPPFYIQIFSCVPRCQLLQSTFFPVRMRTSWKKRLRKELHVINTAQTELHSIGMDGGQALKKWSRRVMKRTCCKTNKEMC